MIRIDFLTLPSGGLLGFSMGGHGGCGEVGGDIGSAAYLTVNTITEFLHVAPLALRVEEGELFFRIEQKDEPACRELLAGLKLHLTQLEEQYSGCLRVEYLEV